MALVKCKECGEQVSTKAKACPKCGAIAPKKTSLFTWIVLFLIIYVIYAVMNQSPSPYVSSSSIKKSKSQSSASKSTKTAQSQKKALPKATWTHSKSKDEMTGKKSAYATSPIIEPTKKMGFPYSDVKAWLGVGCDGKSEWAYIGFNNAPNLSDTDTEDGYNLIRTRIKWDGKIDNIKLIQTWGASFIHFQNDKSIISNIANSNSMLLELKWYGEQTSYFEFPLGGSSAALKSNRSLCFDGEKTNSNKIVEIECDDGTTYVGNNIEEACQHISSEDK